MDDHDSTLKTMCRQATQAMEYLHSNGICHGGLLLSCLTLSRTSLIDFDQISGLRIFSSSLRVWTTLQKTSCSRSSAAHPGNTRFSQKQESRFLLRPRNTLSNRQICGN